LAALEHHLGVPLLRRTTRRIHLMDEGAQYIEQCRLILSAIQEAEDALVSRRRDLKGNFTATAPVQFGRRYVSPFLAEFLMRHPGLTADLLLLNRVANPVEEGVDVAVRIAHLKDWSLVAIPVGHVRRVACASAAYLDRHGTPQVPNDIKRHRCIRHTVLTPRSEWHFRLGQRNVTIPIFAVLVSNEIESALSACMSGLGLGMFLSYMVAPYVRHGKLSYVLERFGAEPTPVQIVYSSSKLIPSNVRAFVDECAKELRHLKFD
jgi:DNA-binding transcriptional LysR family regulator